MNNLTEKNENYYLHINSKDSFNVSDINSKCNEWTIFPLNLLLEKINKNSGFLNINPNNYIHNNCILDKWIIISF